MFSKADLKFLHSLIFKSVFCTLVSNPFMKQLVIYETKFWFSWFWSSNFSCLMFIVEQGVTGMDSHLWLVVKEAVFFDLDFRLQVGNEWSLFLHGLQTWRKGQLVLLHLFDELKNYYLQKCMQSCICDCYSEIVKKI